jgi:hypothetical protein
MKSNNHSTHSAHDLSEAISLFLKELPDPQRSKETTITNRFLVEEQEVLLRAQKCKGSAGMQWKVDPVKKRYLG